MTVEAGQDDMLLDPELLPIMLDQRRRNSQRAPFANLDPKMMRQRASQEFVAWNSDPTPVAEVLGFDVPLHDRSISVRLYNPIPNISSGVLVYFHGGGWVIGDLELEDGALRRIANTGQFRILSIHYRLAPEHPFPAAIEDGEAVINWLVANGSKYGIDPDRIAVGGGSAGANIALGTTLRLRDRQGPRIANLLLLHGAFSHDEGTPSYTYFGNGRFGLPKSMMNYFWGAYLGGGPDHPHAVPIKADLAGLPPTIVIEAELDVLADDSKQLTQLLRKAGVSTERHVYAGAIHGFTQYFKASSQARRSLDEMAMFLKATLAVGRKIL